MWHSIEILVPDADPSVTLDFGDCDLTVIESDPPLSHRRPKSLWQPRFDALGGRLFHLGDPASIKVRQDRYYVYDAFAPHLKRSNFFPFRPEWQPGFEAVVTRLCQASQAGVIHVTDDVWLGPKPKSYKRPVPVSTFLTKVRDKGLRANSFRTVVRDV